MIRHPDIPLADRSVETFDRIGPDTARRLRLGGIHTIGDLQRASEHRLQRAGLTDFEIHAVRHGLAKLIPADDYPKGAA